MINQYILDKYSADGPSLILGTSEERAHSALSTKIFDTYMQPVQGCMYRKAASAEERAADLSVIDENLHTLEAMCSSAGGPFFSGSEPSGSDMSLFPSFVFFEFMLTRHFKWADWAYDKPALKAWYESLKTGAKEGGDFSKVTQRVYGEIHDALVAWEEGGRWEVQGVEGHIQDNQHLKWVYP